ncbi:MAG: exo-alpha-sialidase [Planctomycetes bacterium]|nr:exo-alpha-sialidase [Planctomycetota bacterium]
MFGPWYKRESSSAIAIASRVVVPLAAMLVGVLNLAQAEAPKLVEPQLVDVFTRGKEGYHTFRIPALIVTKDGTLLAISEGRKTSAADHGDVDLVLKRSSDGGKNWGPVELIYEEGGEKKITIGNPCPVVDRDTGVIWLPFTRDNADVFVTSSSDSGRSWSKPQRITPNVKKPNWTWYATGPGNAIQLTRGKFKGRLVIPCDHRVDDKPRREATRSHVIYSDDHGRSWKLGGVTDFLMNECAVVELADGTLMLNMRSYRGKGRRAISLSKDGGLTWTPCRDDPSLVEPVCQASLIGYASPGDGKLRLLFSNPATTTGRHHLTVRMSSDEGKTWPKNILLYKDSAAYSCLASLPDGDAGILFERDGYERITFSRLKLAWISAGERREP